MIACSLVPIPELLTRRMHVRPAPGPALPPPSQLLPQIHGDKRRPGAALRRTAACTERVVGVDPRLLGAVPRSVTGCPELGRSCLSRVRVLTKRGIIATRCCGCVVLSSCAPMRSTVLAPLRLARQIPQQIRVVHLLRRIEHCHRAHVVLPVVPWALATL